MTRLLTLLVTLGGILLAPASTLAQDVAITNARIVVGNGNVIERGTIVVRRGQIQSVGAAPASVTGLRTIDANGMTAMPGFVDAHRHINTGPDEKAQMQALEALCLDICSRHPIPPHRVLAHSDVAPGRKRDPGEKFDWAPAWRHCLAHAPFFPAASAARPMEPTRRAASS